MAGGESELRSVECRVGRNRSCCTPHTWALARHHHHPTLLAYYTTLHLDNTARGEDVHVSVGNSDSICYLATSLILIYKLYKGRLPKQVPMYICARPASC